MSESVGLFDAFGDECSAEFESMERTVSVLIQGEENERCFPIAVINVSNSEMVWHNEHPGLDVCQSRVNDFLTEQKQSK